MYFKGDRYNERLFLCRTLEEVTKVQSSLISKVEKAMRYAQEPGRVTVSDFTAVFRGEHDSYRLTYKGNVWHCSCHFFSQWKTCSHTMALQKILGQMLPQEAAAATPE